MSRQARTYSGQIAPCQSYFFTSSILTKWPKRVRAPTTVLWLMNPQLLELALEPFHHVTVVAFWSHPIVVDLRLPEQEDHNFKAHRSEADRRGQRTGWSEWETEIFWRLWLWQSPFVAHAAVGHEWPRTRISIWPSGWPESACSLESKVLVVLVVFSAWALPRYIFEFKSLIGCG